MFSSVNKKIGYVRVGFLLAILLIAEIKLAKFSGVKFLPPEISSSF